jgi:hypothetical protein
MAFTSIVVMRFSPCLRRTRRCHGAHDTRHRLARYALPGRDVHPLDRAGVLAYRLVTLLYVTENIINFIKSKKSISSWITIRRISGYLGCQVIRRYRPDMGSCKRIPTCRDFVELARLIPARQKYAAPHAPRNVGRHRCSVTPARGMA